jgi:hypothetical protein
VQEGSSQRSAQWLVTKSRGLKSAHNRLISNGPILLRFWIKRLKRLAKKLTLNQRVQGSSPCAPTNKINNLIRIVLPARTPGVTPRVTGRGIPRTSGIEAVSGMSRNKRPPKADPTPTRA